MQSINVEALRMGILSKHKNFSECARSMGWKPSKLNRIMRAEQELSETDINQLAKNLDIQTCEEFVNIFFPTMSTKWTNVKS